MSHLALVLNCLVLLGADSPELNAIVERDHAPRGHLRDQDRSAVDPQ